jgi:hypothetical protein
MKRVHYAGGSFVTGDQVAEALLSYAASLADRGVHRIVTFPAVSDDGETGTATLLLVPTQGLLVTDALHVDADLDEASALEELARVTGQLRLNAGASEQIDRLSSFDDLD